MGANMVDNRVKEFRCPCGEKDPEKYYKRLNKGNNKYYYDKILCKIHKDEEYRNWYKENPSIGRNNKLKKKYKITLEEYENKLREQKHCCACCGDSWYDGNEGDYAWHVDHDHETGQNRDILCRSCNHMLGHAKDSIDRLEKAIAYLRKHGK